VHYFDVSSSDAVGNSASDDNSGGFFTFETGRDTVPDFPSSDTPVAIPDNNPTGASSTITVTNGKTVLDVDVQLDITHTYTGDLSLYLDPPLGASIQLANRRGGSGQNFSGTRFDDEAGSPISSGTAPFAGTFRPDQPLSSADGIDSAGDWTLRVVDQAGADVGTIDSWHLILTYPPQACGPHASYASHGLEDDACAVPGGGENNGVWEAGEDVQFHVTLDNDGSDPLSGVTAQITPLTAGVAMLDPAASFPDLGQGGSGGSLAPHFTARLAGGLGCGDPIQFRVDVTTNEGDWSSVFTQTVGQVILGGGTALAESFDAGALPASWSVVDGFGDGNTWYADNAADPAGCANTDPAAPISGSWAAVDSDCPGSGVTMDEALVSPLLDLSGATTVSLDFDHWFRWYSGGLDEKGDVDVRSSLTGGSWVNVARWSGGSTANPAHAALDLTAQAAGASDVQIRWRYWDADFEWTWFLDNVLVAYTAPGGCDMLTCSAGGSGPPPVPAILPERLTTSGDRISIAWDDQCLPASVKILYGPLGQVASYTVSGAVCDVASPADWDPVPAGDLWFVLVADDGSGAESSWGLASAGERNGSVASGTCGSTFKDLSGTCP
jgi:subtilisin-like proprotein convertase family protein